MNIKHAQYMLTVMQEGSITAAAKKLYISQPSLSQMIKLVETNLGTPIFNRSTDPITLTYAGEKYIEAAKQILTINNNLQKEIDEINHEDHGLPEAGHSGPARHAGASLSAASLYEEVPLCGYRSA